MPDAHESNYEAKLAVHDREIQNLNQAISGLSNALEENAEAQWKAIKEQGDSLREAIRQQGLETRKELAQIANAFNESRTIKWPVIMSVVGAGIAVTSLAVTVLVVIGTMSLDPIKKSIEDHVSDGHPHRVEKMVMSNESKNSEALEGLQSQITASQDKQNITDQFMFILMNNTRRDAGLEPYDMPMYWPKSDKSAKK